MSTNTLLAPNGQTGGTLHCGPNSYQIGADGTVTVQAVDVPGLLAGGFTIVQPPALPTLALTTGTVNYSSLTPLTVLTGTLSGNVTIVLPNAAAVREFDISQVVMGANTITFQSGSGTSAALAAADVGSTVTKHQLVLVRTTGNNGVRIGI